MAHKSQSLPTPTLQLVPLPDKAFKSGRLRVYAERHPTSFLLLQDELVDDLCERKHDRKAADISEKIVILSLTPSSPIQTKLTEGRRDGSQVREATRQTTSDDIYFHANRCFRLRS